jgi:hypothetical protein
MTMDLGLATTAIAVLGISIAWGQWHTARCKLSLDLFNQRMDIYRKVCLAIEIVLRDGATNTQSVMALSPLRHDARFLFGTDVNDNIELASKAMLIIAQTDRAINSGTSGTATASANNAALESLTKVYDALPELVSTYCRMDQPLPPRLTKIASSYGSAIRTSLQNRK